MPYSVESEMDRVPCRVSADLRKYQREQNALELNAPEFDEFDDQQVKDACGALAGPVQGLLTAYAQMVTRGEMTESEKANFLDSIRGDLKELRRAVRAEWESL